MNPINALNLTRPKPDQHPIAEQIIREGFERGRREVGTVQVPATIDYRVVLNDLRARKARLAEFSEQLDTAIAAIDRIAGE